MLFFNLFSHSQSCAVHHTDLSLTNQQANFASLQAIWHWFPWGPPQSPAGLQHYSLLGDNLNPPTLVMWATTESGGNMAQCCLPVRGVDDTVPSPFAAPFAEICKSNMLCNTSAVQDTNSKIIGSDVTPYLNIWDYSQFLIDAARLKWLNYCHICIWIITFPFTDSAQLQNPCISACDPGFLLAVSSF